MFHLFLITGCSRGLGLGMAKSALARGHSVLGFARSKPDLDHQRFRYRPLDLGTPESACKAFQSALEELDTTLYAGIHFIQNAGVVRPLAPIINHEARAVSENLTINLLTPSLLTSAFLKTMDPLPVQKSLTTVSSGLATSALSGSAVYSAAKAGLRMHTLTLAIELGGRSDWRVHSFSPGVIDTEMQSQIRESSECDFTEVERFREFQKSGALRPPDEVGNAWIETLLSDAKAHQVEIKISEIL